MKKQFVKCENVGCGRVVSRRGYGWDIVMVGGEKKMFCSDCSCRIRDAMSRNQRHRISGSVARANRSPAEAPVGLSLSQMQEMVIRQSQINQSTPFPYNDGTNSGITWI